MSGGRPMGIIKQPEYVHPLSIVPVPYNMETVGHLTDQLIKLQKSYDSNNGISSKVEIDKAMKTINKALESVLLNVSKSIVQFDEMKR
jgi:hypothetical protein